jgi:hypothetical protein
MQKFFASFFQKRRPFCGLPEMSVLILFERARASRDIQAGFGWHRERKNLLF